MLLGWSLVVQYLGLGWIRAGKRLAWIVRVRQGASWGYGLWIGWFACKRYTWLGSPSLSLKVNWSYEEQFLWISKGPKLSKHHKIQKIFKNIINTPPQFLIISSIPPQSLTPTVIFLTLPSLILTPPLKCPFQVFISPSNFHLLTLLLGLLWWPYSNNLYVLLGQ